MQAGLAPTTSTNPHSLATRSEHDFGPFPAPSCELVTMMCLGSARLGDSLISSPRVFCSLNGQLLSLPEESPCGLTENKKRSVWFSILPGEPLYFSVVNRTFRFLVWKTDTVPSLTDCGQSDLHLVWAICGRSELLLWLSLCGIAERPPVV
jgi:hypothetical protein